MSTVITPQQFLTGYMQELQKVDEREWERPKKMRTKFTKAAAMAVIKNHVLDPHPEVLIPSREYFRVDVLGHQEIGDRDCNWMLRVAFEHENPGWHNPDTQWGAPSRRPYWIQELCKLTHLFADLHVLAAYHNSNKDGDLKQLLQSNVNRMQKEGERMTRFGQWLFIFGPEPLKLAGFRAFTLGGGNGTVVMEMKMP